MLWGVTLGKVNYFSYILFYTSMAFPLPWKEMALFYRYTFMEMNFTVFFFLLSLQYDEILSRKRKNMYFILYPLF